MSKYVIYTDSSCDLPIELAQKLQIKVLPLSFVIEEKTYQNLLDWSEMSQKDFYDMLRQGKVSKTFQVNSETFTSEFEKTLQEGYDILYVGFSSALSGTFASSTIAQKDLTERYPDRKIIVLDSLCASLGQGLLLYNAANLKSDGKSIDEVASYIEENKLKLNHWFTVGDLNFLKRGGRVSGTAAFIGTVFQIKPILYVSDTGQLIPRLKIRGRKHSLIQLVDKMEQNGINLENQMIFISHGDCLEDATFVKNLILERFKVKDVVINAVGPVIGSHSGPGTVALFFMGNNR